MVLQYTLPYQVRVQCPKQEKQGKIGMNFVMISDLHLGRMLMLLARYFSHLNLYISFLCICKGLPSRQETFTCLFSDTEGYQKASLPGVDVKQTNPPDGVDTIRKDDVFKYVKYRDDDDEEEEEANNGPRTYFKDLAM